MKTSNRRTAFTLVELLITMSIIALLSALAMMAVGSAAEAAKTSHTRAVIARLHSLLMDRVESYRYRRLPIGSTAGTTPAMAAQTRCLVVRDLLRMELPDRFADITDAPDITYYIQIPNPNPPPQYNDQLVTISVSPSTVYELYRNAYATAGSPTDTTYQGADCLYWIVTMGLEENDVMENFSQSDIGSDPKNPSLRCFVDAWGNPIQFLRWAPGFRSPLQPAQPTDPDQTDPTGQFGTPPNTFALYPLIYSAGPDGLYDLAADTPTPFHYAPPSANVPPYPWKPNDPFSSATSAGAIWFGTAINSSGQRGDVDNITNQEK